MKNRFYVDESGINKYLRREHVRCQAGNQVYGAVSGMRYARGKFYRSKESIPNLSSFLLYGNM